MVHGNYVVGGGGGRGWKLYRPFPLKTSRTESRSFHSMSNHGSFLSNSSESSLIPVHFHVQSCRIPVKP
jgi:hypothetical protein